MNVYYVIVQYGRGEMRTTTLVAANTEKEANKLARADAPVPCYDGDVTCTLIRDLTYTGPDPVVIRRVG